MHCELASLCVKPSAWRFGKFCCVRSSGSPVTSRQCPPFAYQCICQGCPAALRGSGTHQTSQVAEAVQRLACMLWEFPTACFVSKFKRSQSSSSHLCGCESNRDRESERMDCLHRDGNSPGSVCARDAAKRWLCLLVCEWTVQNEISLLLTQCGSWTEVEQRKQLAAELGVLLARQLHPQHAEWLLWASTHQIVKQC